jgi:hypothetical protein
MALNQDYQVLQFFLSHHISSSIDLIAGVHFASQQDMPELPRISRPELTRSFAAACWTLLERSDCYNSEAHDDEHN